MPNFAPKKGVPYTQEDAEIVCPAILEVVDSCGGAMDKDDIVAAAKKRGSPLKPYVFNKNKEEAAQMHYRGQAGKLMRSFEVVWVQDHQQRRADLTYYVEILPPEDDDEEARGARRRNKSRKKGHISATTMLSEEAYQQQQTVAMRQELADFRYRYEEFKHLIDFRTKFGRIFRGICDLFDEEVE